VLRKARRLTPMFSFLRFIEILPKSRICLA
jgi:hypothetical protein